MEGFAEEGKAVGLVLDVSLRHDHDGNRLIDLLRRQFIQIINKAFEDGLDAFYLYHPEIVESVYKVGEATAAVSNYESDGWLFNLNHALQQTLYVLGCEDQSLRRYLIFVSDRVQRPEAFDRLLFLNQKDRIEASLVLVGVGDRYNSKAFPQASDGLTVLHLDNPSELLASILKEKTHGDQNACSPTTERSERVQLASGPDHPLSRPVCEGCATFGDDLPPDPE